MSDSKKTLNDLKRDIENELKKQREQREEIKKAQTTLRDLRQKKSELASQRAENEAYIRELKVELNEDREIARDKSNSDEMREAARERIQEHNVTITGFRRDISKQDSSIASLNTQVQRTLGNKEHRESLLSQSRTNQRETVSRTRMMEAVDSLTPQALRGQISKTFAPDAQLDALRAGDSVRRGGGTAGEQRGAQQASAEFSSLFESIKETRKALAGLTEGTEEHKKKQEELVVVETKATEALSKLEKIERDVEKRRLSTSNFSSSFAGQAMGYAGAAMRLGAEGFDRMGGVSTERYVMEEQRKQAELSIQNMSLTDTRMRTRDATSFLATGAGSLFGAETPYGPNGASDRIRGLGRDYANAREAMPQYSMMMNTMGGAVDVASSAIGKGIEGAAINPITGAFAGGGELIRGGARLGLGTLQSAAFTPEIGGRFGFDKATGAAMDINNALGGTFNTMGKSATGLLSKGGGDGAMYAGGIDKITNSATEMANALPKVMQRAYESVEQMNRLVSAEQQAAQINRVRERLGMAFAPALQQYMDVQGTQKSTLRSSSMSRRDREGYENDLEGFSLDDELGDRGFGVGQILGATNQAARGLGRFGRGGMNQRVAKSGMMAESMGLGDASSSIQAMIGMKSGGIDDPEALFTKAVKEGLQRGLQDSRQFQELLASAAATSDGVGDFEGALKGILMFGGSGRANDVSTASAAAKTAEDRMSGKTGTWRDMVKFDVTNRAAKDAMSAAKSQGIDMSREDMTSLQNLANVDVKQFDNPEFLDSILTTNAKKAIMASGKSVAQYGSDISNNLRVQGTLGDSVNSTQSPELAELRNNLATGNIKAIKEKYKNNPGRLRDLVALAGSGAMANGDAKDAAGGQQMIINKLKEGGIDTSGMGMQRGFEAQNYDTVRAESAAANTMGEQMDRGDAQISQTNMANSRTFGRDAAGKNLLAEAQSGTRNQYVDKNNKMIENISNERTAEPTLEVKRLDEAIKQMVDGFKEIKESMKNFSPKELVVNAGKDIVIQGANSIKGVVLDNALTQAATEAGTVIADKVRDAFSSDRGASSGSKAPAQTKSVPAPQGT